MEQQISISEIAQKLNLSPSTVSRALSGKGRVGEATRKMIMDYLEKQSYVPNIRTSTFSDKKTKTIGVVLPLDGNYAELPFFSKMLMSLYDYFYAYDYNTLLIRISPNDLSALKSAISRHIIDGIVLTRLLPDGSDVEMLQKKGVPFVVTGSSDDKTICQVDADQRRACRELTGILLKMGIRNTVLMCGDHKQTITQDRIRGYQDALRENDIVVNELNIFENAGDDNVLEKALIDILKMETECVICSDDGICISVLNYFSKMGIRVPDDIKVASFYNSLMLEEHNSSITSIEFDIKEWAKKAGGMLMKLLEGDDCDSKQMVGYHLLLKESTKFTHKE